MFVAMTNSLCMPINRNLPAEVLCAQLLYDFKLQFDTRRKWRETRLRLPHGKFFHVPSAGLPIDSRVTRFDVTTFDALLAQIDQP